MNAKNLWNPSLAAVLAAGLILLLAAPLAAQNRRCDGIAFSTEEDFVTHGPKPADGNPVISDGDLLIFTPPGGVAVCARNRELLEKFQIRPDLGLDAADVLDARGFLIAFSTELDDPAGRFTAGDLLLTNGGVLPNAALMAKFDLPRRQDIGLDAVHFIGRPDALRQLVAVITERGRDFWLEAPGELVAILERLRADIWFSTEGTALPYDNPRFLDGDLLSARDGIIVARNSLLLPPPVPAGIPDRGVDFGLDAVSGSREPDRESIHFSTEILFHGRPGFNDGDVLRLGGGVVIPHVDLIQGFEPKADFLGLDALSFRPVGPLEEPNIQTLCGLSYPVIDFDGGRVGIGDPGTGLYRANSTLSPPGDPPRQPCGRYVAVDGYLPAAGVQRFRVAYRPAGAAPPAPGTADGIVTDWLINQPVWIVPWLPPVCLPVGSLSTDGDGWMDASAYLAAKSGPPCASSGLQLAVWATHALPPGDRDAHYVLWLEWEPSGGGPLQREPFEHHLQLDNTLPKIADFPDGLQVRLPGGDPDDLVPACGEAPKGSNTFEVWGQFADDYYWSFSLRLRGGLPPAAQSYGPHNYYDATDGPPGLKHTDDTGTAPDLTTVHLRNIFMTDLGESFQDCCYVLDLWVRDAAIRHSFNKIVVNDVSGSSSFQANAFVTFAAAP